MPNADTSDASAEGDPEATAPFVPTTTPDTKDHADPGTPVRDDVVRGTDQQGTEATQAVDRGGDAPEGRVSRDETHPAAKDNGSQGLADQESASPEDRRARETESPNPGPIAVNVNDRSGPFRPSAEDRAAYETARDKATDERRQAARDAEAEAGFPTPDPKPAIDAAREKDPHSAGGSRSAEQDPTVTAANGLPPL